MTFITRRFTQARSIEDYGTAGYVLSVVVLTGLAFLVELTASNAPVTALWIARVRDAAKGLAEQVVPAAAPIMALIASLPVLVFVLLLPVGARGEWRVNFGNFFANSAFGIAGHGLSLGEVFIRHRTMAALVLGALGVLVPLGFTWQRHHDLERAARSRAYERWVHRVQAFVDSTSLSQEDQQRALELVKRFKDNNGDDFVAPQVALDLVRVFEELYGASKERDWIDRVDRVALNFDPPKDESGVLASANRMLLARARFRHAETQNCTALQQIDEAAELFKAAASDFPKSAAYGLGMTFRCALDYRLRQNSSGQLRLCATAAECARRALGALMPAESAQGCDEVELKRRNNKLDVLIRIATSYDSFGRDDSIRVATSPAALIKQIKSSQDNLEDCGQLYRLRDGIAFRTLAESQAAVFTLSARQNSNGAPPSPDVTSLARESARWLLAARLVAPKHGQTLWDWTPFCAVFKNDTARVAFSDVLGDPAAGERCNHR
jgi:hypothetical protein